MGGSKTKSIKVLKVKNNFGGSISLKYLKLRNFFQYFVTLFKFGGAQNPQRLRIVLPLISKKTLQSVKKRVLLTLFYFQKGSMGGGGVFN